MRTLVVVLAAAAAFATAACNTVEGAGRDMSSAGQAVSTTAQDARN
jgi:predicted small secreted protein